MATTRRGSDRITALLAVGLFSHGMGAGIVAVPLIALAAGYDASSVGFLVAVAALSQLTVRLGTPWLLGRYSDRSLSAVSAACLVASFSALALSTALPVFLVAQILQGVGRGVFWTSSQTHAIRDTGHPVQRLVDLNLAGNAGTLSGPLVAGALGAIDLRLALLWATGAATGATLGSLALHRLPPFDRKRSRGTLSLLHRPGIAASNWGSVVGGGWWAMLGSFVPVLLVAAGVGTLGVGGLITASEAAGLGALILLRRLPTDRVSLAVAMGGFVACGSLIGLALAPPLLSLYVLLLIIGGAASGTVTTLGPALAAAAASPEEQGDALAMSGTFRAGALLGAPAGVGAVVAVAPLSVGLFALGAGLAAVGVVVERGWSHALSAPRA
ncbi:MAG TPA: MFS transporter [Candidatus Limnocylindrales bacterium]|nr:MFS transporter [Candidatus Limnocylindrales bacterium]